MILHIMPKENLNVFVTYIEFINKNFNPDNHVFVTINSRINIPEKILKQTNVIIIEERKKAGENKLFELINKSERTIFHSLIGVFRLRIKILKKPSLFNKIFWVGWGVDLYEWKYKNNTLKNIIINYIRYTFNKKIKNFIGVFPPDLKVFQKQFNPKANKFYAPYVGGLFNEIFYKEIVSESLENKIKNKDTINILVGHHCNRNLNHIEVLDKLYKYKEYNVKIYIPLNYGDMRYGDQVEKYASRKYGEKVVCLREYVPQDKYLEFLSSIDIAIFNTDRQIGLGNINTLLHLGKKIYIPKGTVMYDYFVAHNVEISDFHCVNNINFKDFTKAINIEKGKKYIEDYVTNSKLIFSLWDAIFKASVHL